MNSSDSKPATSGSRLPNKKLTALESGVAGALSGFMTRAVLQPLDVLKIRFQLQIESTRRNKGGLYNGIIQAAITIYKQEGAVALWKGHVPAQALTVAYGISQFYTFTLLKNQASKYNLKENGTVTFACGGLAGIVATLVSFPFDVARTRIVAQSVPEFTGIMDVWKKTLANENVFCLWRGLTPTLLMTVPQTAIQFGMYYSLKSLLSNDNFKEDYLNAARVSKPVLCGAVAGATAKFIVYPFDVLKKRIQIRGVEDVRSGFGKVVAYTSTWDCIRRITIEEGPSAWLKGMHPSLVKCAAFSGLVFTFYEMSVCALLHIRGKVNRE